MAASKAASYQQNMVDFDKPLPDPRLGDGRHPPPKRPQLQLVVENTDIEKGHHRIDRWGSPLARLPLLLLVSILLWTLIALGIWQMAGMLS